MVDRFPGPLARQPILEAPIRFHRTSHAALERRVVAAADAIIANTEKNRESLEAPLSSPAASTQVSAHSGPHPKRYAPVLRG